MNARRHHQFINFGDLIQRFLIHARNDFADIFQPVRLVARIDPFGRITDLEIHAAFQPGSPFQDRDADFLGHARINRAFKNHDTAGFQIFTQDPARTFHWAEVGGMVVMDGGRHRHDMETRFLQMLWIVGEFHCCIPDHIIADFMGRIGPVPILQDLLSVQIESDDLDFPCERNGNRHSDIPQTDQGKFRISI